MIHQDMTLLMRLGRRLLLNNMAVNPQMKIGGIVSFL
jgi:hypothetical protein